MSPLVWTILLFAVGTAWFLLPFVPGFREVRYRRDAGALQVRPEDRVDIQQFATGFAEFLQSELGDEIRRCRESGDRIDGQLNENENYLIVPETEAFVETPEERLAQRTDRIIVGTGELHLPDDLHFTRELYAKGTVHGGLKGRYRAVLSEQDVELAAESLVERWVHADRALVVNPKAQLYGRASAEGSIFIHGECRFERMRAPMIELGPREFDEGWREGREDLRPLEAEDLPKFKDLTGRRALIDGNLDLPEGTYVDADLVVLGNLVVGKGSSVRGNIKAHGTITLEDGVQVDGSLVSPKNIVIGAGCRVHGPVLSEQEIHAAARCQFGRALMPTTLRADHIVLTMESVIHGTVWSSHDGEVVT